MADTYNSMSVQQMGPPHASQECFLASVLVPRAASTRDIVALETAMQGLAQDDRHPVALELAATASSRGFLLRATSAMSLSHLCGQIQARYPQAIIQPVSQENDPLALRQGEKATVVELSAGAAAYLPLRAFREREWQQEGADPLLGILGVFNHLPLQMRVVTQLALLPASPTWSSPYLRKAVEHPLEQEYLRTRSGLSGRQASGPGTFQLVGLGVLVAVLLLWWRFQKQINAHIPAWVVQAALSLLHGKLPQLSQGQVSLLVAIEFPDGWNVENGRIAVAAKEPRQNALMLLQLVTRPIGGTIDAVALRSMQSAGLRPLSGASALRARRRHSAGAREG